MLALIPSPPSSRQTIAQQEEAAYAFFSQHWHKRLALALDRLALNANRSQSLPQSLLPDARLCSAGDANARRVLRWTASSDSPPGSAVACCARHCCAAVATYSDTAAIRRRGPPCMPSPESTPAPRRPLRMSVAAAESSSHEEAVVTTRLAGRVRQAGCAPLVSPAPPPQFRVDGGRSGGRPWPEGRFQHLQRPHGPPQRRAARPPPAPLPPPVTRTSSLAATSAASQHAPPRTHHTTHPSSVSTCTF